jgi:hypothetical protein
MEKVEVVVVEEGAPEMANTAERGGGGRQSSYPSFFHRRRTFLHPFSHFSDP